MKHPAGSAPSLSRTHFAIAGFHAVGRTGTAARSLSQIWATAAPFPVPCERLLLRPLSRGGVNASMVVIDSLRAKESATVKEVLADILYSQSVAENWVQPMRERGITPTFKLHPNDRGPRYDQALGVLWIDGWPH